MTATTHQMIALCAALFVLTLYPHSVGWIVGVLSVIAVMSGALTPDLDQPTAAIWRKMLGSNTVGNFFEVFSGGHRHLTHSVIGIIGIGWLLQWGIHHLLNPAFIPAAEHMWRAFMIGYISHPIADTVTDIGVPLLWPLHWRLRLPPGPEEVRVTTGSFVETVLVRGAVLIVVMLLLSKNWDVVRNFFHAA